MKQQLILFALLLTSLCSYSQTLEFKNTYDFIGTVQLVPYETASGEKFESYILKLDTPISVEAQEDWTAVESADEVDLNIVYDKIFEFEGKKVKITGLLFQDKGEHQIREASVKVETVELL